MFSRVFHPTLILASVVIGRVYGFNPSPSRNLQFHLSSPPPPQLSLKTNVRTFDKSRFGVSLGAEAGLKERIMDWASRKDPNTCQTPLDQASTLSRIVVPAVFAAAAAFLVFPPLAIFLATLVNNAGVFAVLSQDSSQFVQNFLTVGGLLFSILVGQTYYFMYQQQEAVYYALFSEVTEAKSLLEQTALLTRGRPLYGKILKCIDSYVKNDLKMLKVSPTLLLSRRPDLDPLESIMYYTSVGTPSAVYDTVRTLRQARATR
jgi:hypothetical protein